MSFAFVSGNLALDFAGTLKWRRARPEELLNTVDDLARWAVEAGIFTESFAASAQDLDRLRDLREAAYRVMAMTLASQSPQADDLALLNCYAAGQPPQVGINADGVVRTGTAESIGWAVARDAAELLSRARDLRICECARTHCTRIFIDRSRTGNRRWCGMQECGNRVKAANYRARRTPAIS